MNIKGELEIDHKRGVIYFHTLDENTVTTFGGVTILRICNLPKPIPRKSLLDITHMRGQSWK